MRGRIPEGARNSSKPSMARGSGKLATTLPKRDISRHHTSSVDVRSTRSVPRSSLRRLARGRKDMYKVSASRPGEGRDPSILRWAQESVRIPSTQSHRPASPEPSFLFLIAHQARQGRGSRNVWMNPLGASRPSALLSSNLSFNDYMECALSSGCDHVPLGFNNGCEGD